MKRAFRKSWGAELVDGRARFRLWAPAQDRLAVRCDGADHAMTPADGGWFETTLAGVDAGAEYGFVLDDGRVVPDPAARADGRSAWPLSRD